MHEWQSRLSDVLRGRRGVTHNRQRLVGFRGRRISRVGVTQDRLSSCDVRVQLNYAAEEFGCVGLQLDGACGVCGTASRYLGQDRKAIAFDLL